MLEDHENLVENMLYWTRDSPNKMRFVEKLEKYSVFNQPEVKMFYILILTPYSKIIATKPMHWALVEQPHNS